MAFVKPVPTKQQKEKRNNMKKLLLISILCISACLFIGCSDAKTESGKNNTNEKKQIVTTLFPQYDFAKQIVGDQMDVSLLLPTGVESHAFEPTPKDVLNIQNAALFIYTGENMEAWAPKLLTDIDPNQTKVLDISANLPLIDGANQKEENAKDHAAHEEETDIHTMDDGHNHSTGMDPHVWTSLSNAKLILQEILQAIIEVDPENQALYAKNAENYLKQLNEVDQEIQQIVDTGKRKKIIFAGHFALSYFAKQYGLEYVAAYPSTSSDAEPGVKDIAAIIDQIKAENIPVIYYEELVDPKVAQSIHEQTGAKMLLLHSLHNVSKDEFKQGVTYVSLMKQNAQNLKEGLN